MQRPTLIFIVFFSALSLTLAFGGVALWLALENPKFAEQLFNTSLSLFAFGAGGIMGLIGGNGLCGH
ncbi:MAG TPA: hypothetical protein VK430_05490 [Xanthobacteraceae bacterium]|nr:hypothetical protein [Xanthobacteraceae bacterium]